MIWMYLVTLVGFGCAIFCMAEMASMAPTSGGQVRGFFLFFLFFIPFFILFSVFLFCYCFFILLHMDLLIKVKEKANMWKFSIIGM